MSLGSDDRGRGHSVAVVYLARGQGKDYLDHFRAFADSYRSHPAGVDHTLYVVFKGFPDHAERADAERVFEGLAIAAIDTDDLRFDIGAYADSLRSISETMVCFLNTYSVMTTSGWLSKLVRALALPGVGLVGATGSYESLQVINRKFPGFPNPHLRTNAFALRRSHADAILGSYEIGDKLDTFFIESGEQSVTQRIFALGLTCLLVGADGRGFAPDQWVRSGTYRLGMQENLLVHDNYTREFLQLSADERRVLAAHAWGVDAPPSVVDL